MKWTRQFKATSLVLAIVGCQSPEPSAAEVPAPPPRPAVQIDAPAPEPDLAPDQIVAKWNGGSLTYADLHNQVNAELRSLEVQYRLNRYDTQAQALEMMVIEALLEAETKRLGLSDVSTLLEKEVVEKVSDPTEEEIRSFYPVAQRQLRGASLEEARPFLVQELLRRAQSNRYDTFVQELHQRYKIERSFPYPDLPRIDIPIQDHDPIFGSVNAPVTIVQFAEYQCYYCNKVGPTLDRLMQEYPGKVRIVFKDFPLSSHGRSIPAAVAAHCAGEQDRYWEMNRILLNNQQALSDAEIDQYANDLDLNLESFQDCQNANRYEATIQEDVQLGQQAGVDATPTFFVNGILLPGAQSYERFAALVQRELDG